MKKRIHILSLLAVLLLLICAACGKGGNMEKKLVGSWYMNGQLTGLRDGGTGPAFTLYDDGTCEMASEYGTGTWTIVNSNQLKLTNYYGEASVAEISEVTKDKLVLVNGNYTMTFYRTGS